MAVTIAERIHLFPSRTQKLSSLAPKVLGLTAREDRLLPPSMLDADCKCNPHLSFLRLPAAPLRRISLSRLRFPRSFTLVNSHRKAARSANCLQNRSGESGAVRFSVSPARRAFAAHFIVAVTFSSVIYVSKLPSESRPLRELLAKSQRGKRGLFGFRVHLRAAPLRRGAAKERATRRKSFGSVGMT